MRDATNVKKVVIVTGASSGIGEAVARRLAADGCTVVLAARRTDRLATVEREIGEAGGTATSMTTDVTRRDDVAKLVDATVRRFGRLDVLVNNAGVMPLSLLRSGKVEEWDRMVDVNLRGV